jgi:hypothetical protein
MVSLIASVAGGEQNTLGHQLLKMFMDRLPADSESARGDRDDVPRVSSDVSQEELSDIAAGMIVNLHTRYCQPIPTTLSTS